MVARVFALDGGEFSGGWFAAGVAIGAQRGHCGFGVYSGIG